jgi:hypothetical protein
VFSFIHFDISSAVALIYVQAVKTTVNSIQDEAIKCGDMNSIQGVAVECGDMNSIQGVAVECDNMNTIQGVAVECDDMQIAVLMS